MCVKKLDVLQNFFRDFYQQLELQTSLSKLSFHVIKRFAKLAWSFA